MDKEQPAEDADNRVVVHFPIWLRILGGIFFLGWGSMLYFLVQVMSPHLMWFIYFIIVGFFTFLGIYFLGYTSQFIFDHTLGNMTIKTSVGPFTYRTRHLSRRRVLTVQAYEEIAQGAPTLWAVALAISGRKKDLKIKVNNKERAKYLARRIRVFL